MSILVETITMCRTLIAAHEFILFNIFRHLFPEAILLKSDHWHPVFESKHPGVHFC